MARTIQSSVERTAPNTTGFESLTLMSAGVIAGATLTVLTALARSVGLPSMNIENILGSLLLGYIGPSPWMIGFTLHLAISAIVALVYGAAFRRLGSAGPSIGAAFGVVHWLVSSIALGLVSRIHPLMPESRLAPGFFAINTGVFGFFFIFLLHVVFGAIVGTYYQQVCLAHRSLTSQPV